MKKDKKKIENRLLRKYLESNDSDENLNSVKQWLEGSDTEHNLYEESNDFWDQIPLDQDIKGYDGSHILDRIHHLLRIEESKSFNNSRPKAGFLIYLTRIAAILFIPLLVASLLLFYLHLQNNSAGNKVSYAEIYAPFGTRTSFNLPDGTTGKLNGGSSLKFPVQFTGKSRDVELIGEAYFDVYTDCMKPFVVSTEKIDVKAFGTSFNVQAYPDDSITEIILKEGEIEIFTKINDDIRSIGILNPDESYVYDSQTYSGNILPVNSAHKLTWLEGKITFRYEPFSEVIRKINRWYNVDIVIKDELLYTYLYYGTFHDETIDEVLKLFQLTAPISYRNLPRKKEQDGTFGKREIEIYYKKHPN